MRVLFSGDVYGKPGRRILQERVHTLLQEHRVDFCVANVENAAAGFGITPEIAEEFLRSEIDILTSGNHIWDKRAIIPYIAEQPRLLRPQNYPPSSPGTGIFIGDSRCGGRVGIINLQGRVYMPATDCPFAVGSEAVERIRKETKVYLAASHADA